MIGLIALTTIFVFPFLSVMLPLYVRNILKLGPERLGLLMAVSGTGALFGALGLLSVARDHRFRFMTGAVVLVALALFVHVTVEQFSSHRRFDGNSRCWAIGEFRSCQHHRAGTGAGSFARPQFPPSLGSVFLA